jgi:hypothetical protein
VFLTATVAERARRRALDLEQRGFSVPPLAELEAAIAERDRLDSSREVAPLLQAEDAAVVITDGLTIDEVIDALRGDCWARRRGLDWNDPVQARIRAASRRAFFPDTDTWRELVLARTRQCIRQALDGVGAA